ncbi:choice-of-anchor J domain-containing protein [Winogradskyella sp. A2]|uniref:choice-of-anchor J domain-containing protein n=1 Tax=Winogradskyella sp. A2 TaxID=3366944 RepID=UPI00398C4057
MKKITLLFLTLCMTISSYAQFPEDFSGGVIPAGWAVFDNGNGTAQSWMVAGTTNPYAIIVWENVAFSVAEDWLVTPQFTVDGTNFILSFDQTDSSGIDYGSIATVRISTASQTTPTDFTIVDTQTEADLWAGGPFAQHTVDLTAYIGQSIYVAFVMENDDGDLWAIDNVDMISNATAPNPATTPTPADMATNIMINDPGGDDSVTLAWVPATTGDPATAYDVYYGTDPNPPLLGTISNTTVNITGNNYSTLYYWQIVAKNVGGEAVGSSIWSFTTEADASAFDCSVYGIPFSEDFSNVDAYEDCYEVEDSNSDGFTWTRNIGNDIDGDGNGDPIINVQIPGTGATKDEWLFLPVLNGVANTEYQLTVTYNAFDQPGTANESFDIVALDAPSSSATMQTVIGSYSGITQAGAGVTDLLSNAYSNSATYTPTTDGDFYFAVHATTADANGGLFFLISLDVSETLSVNLFEQNNFTHYYNIDSKTLSVETSNMPMTGIEIYSLLGQPVITESLSNTTETIDVSSLSDGVYLAKVSIDGNSKTIKFIKR